MKYPFLILFTSVLLLAFVFMLLACAVTAELRDWVAGKIARRD